MTKTTGCPLPSLLKFIIMILYCTWIPSLFDSRLNCPEQCLTNNKPVYIIFQWDQNYIQMKGIFLDLVWISILEVQSIWIMGEGGFEHSSAPIPHICNVITLPYWRDMMQSVSNTEYVFLILTGGVSYVSLLREGKNYWAPTIIHGQFLGWPSK